MTLLSILGLIAICIAALYFTVGSIVWLFSATAWGGSLAGPCVMGTIAVAWWALAWKLSPFTISVNLT